MRAGVVDSGGGLLLRSVHVEDIAAFRAGDGQLRLRGGEDDQLLGVGDALGPCTTASTTASGASLLGRATASSSLWRGANSGPTKRRDRRWVPAQPRPAPSIRREMATRGVLEAAGHG